MTVRALDPITGDLVTSGTQLLTGYSAAEVAQNVKTRLGMFTNEWFLDITDGTPWFDSSVAPGILSKRSRLNQKEAAIKRRILLTPGLSSMQSFALDYDIATRRLLVNAVIISRSGESASISFSPVI